MYWYGRLRLISCPLHQISKINIILLSLCLVSHQKFMNELDMAVTNQSKQIYWCEK